MANRFDQLDSVFTALAHAARRQILMMVWFDGGTMSSGEIAARFKYAWPTTVRHLRVLESAGLITHQKIGRVVYYKVNEPQLDVLREWLQWFDPEYKRRRKERTPASVGPQP